MSKKVCILAALTLAISVVLVHGQTGLGTLKGYVHDEQGLAIVGAKIELTSESLMGIRSTTSGSSGAYRLINLPPGFYTIKVSLENYQQYEQRGIYIRAGKVSGLNVKLNVGEFEQVIVITGDAPLLDPDASGQTFHISGDFQRSLPLGSRRDFHEIFRMVPGVTLESGIGTEGSSYSVGGANPSYENIFTLDGATMSDFAWGSGDGVRFSTEIIADASIQLTGMDASAGLGQGGHLNIVTKSGGNELSGTFGIYMQLARFNDTNVDGGTPRDESFYQPDISIGGPIIKDKLWYFSSYRYINTTRGINRTVDQIETMQALFPGWTPFKSESDQHRFFGKISYQLNDGNNFFFTYQREAGANVSAGPTSTERNKTEAFFGGPLYILNWNTTLGDNTSIRSQVSYRNKTRDNKGVAGTEPTIAIYESVRNFGFLLLGRNRIASDGNPLAEIHYDMPQWETFVDVDTYIGDFFGSHELNYGIYAVPYAHLITEWNENRFPQEINAVLIDRFDPSKGYRIFHRSVTEGDTHQTSNSKAYVASGYVNDNWKPNRKLTVSLGLRYDWTKQLDNVGDLVFIDAGTFSPRLGLNYALTSDGKNLIRANFARLYESVRGLKIRNFGYAFNAKVDEYDFDGDGILETVEYSPPTISKGENIYRKLDPDLTPSYVNEFSMGYSRELPWSITFSIDYTYREYRNNRIVPNVNPIFENGTFVGVQNPLAAFTRMETNNTWNWLRWQGLDIHLNKRLSNNVQFMASYSHGTQDLRGTWSPYEPFGYIQPDHFSSFSMSDLSYQGSTSNYNRVFNDGPRDIWKFNWVWFAPLGINLNSNVIIQSGRWSGPISYQLDPTDPEVTRFGPRFFFQDGRRIGNPLYSTTRYYYDDRKEGQFQSPAVSTVNIRIGKDLKFRAYTLQAALDVFNLFNSGTDDGFRFGANDKSSRFFGMTANTQPPRVAQIMLRLQF